MKILQLNVWTGRIKYPLKEFFEKSDFDVICLQEAVWTDKKRGVLENFFVSVEQIKELSGMQYDCRSVNWVLDFLDSRMYQGNVILSREKIKSSDVKLVHPGAENIKEPEDLIKHQYTTLIATLNNGLNVVSYHGYWLKDPLGDNTTVKVMNNVANIVKELSGPVAMCGDLNVTSNSPAMQKLGFLHDLIEEYNVKNTLSKIRGNLAVSCDHILVNDMVAVQNFTVLDDIVSDHKGLVVDLELKA